MERNELREMLLELSDDVCRSGTALKLEHNANGHDLKLISRSLLKSHETLESIVNVLINKQL